MFVWYTHTHTHSHVNILPIHCPWLNVVKGIYLHEKTLNKQDTLAVICTGKCNHFLQRDSLGLKTTHLLNVIVKTPHGEVGQVVIFADALRVLSGRQEEDEDEVMYSPRAAVAPPRLINAP